MEVNTILRSNILDIIFDNRNKTYGAYELRKQYNKRLSKALVITASFALLATLASFLNVSGSSGKGTDLSIKDLKMIDLAPEDKVEVVTQPRPKIIEQPRIQMAQLSTLKLVDEVKPDEQMKDIAEIQEAKIGFNNVQGEKSDDIVAPPIEDGSGVIVAPKANTDEHVFRKVEIEAQFPGGEKEWIKYITREMNRHIDELTEDGKAGKCIIQFIVDIEGNISGVECLTMKGTKLAEICENAIRKGPKWTPAVQNGNQVKAYRTQPVVFQINE